MLIYLHSNDWRISFIKLPSITWKKYTSKLRTYSILKTTPGFETYLSEIQHIDQRIALTKFRLSNHCLRIETGRHERIEKNKRFCPFCPNQIEDEKHALLKCETYKIHRTDLFCSLEMNLLTSTNTNRDLSLFKVLLTHPTYQAFIAKYLDRIFSCREFLLKNHRNHI